MNVSSGVQAVALAMRWLGTPYQWGGGHGGAVRVGTPVDCSGLVNQVFGVTGTTYTQVALGTPVSSINQACPGDLVFFGPPQAPGEAYHVGIYSGAGMMIDAPHTGTSVRYDSVGGFGQIAAIRRLVPCTGGGNGTPGTTVGTGNVQYDYAQLEGVWIQAGGNQQYMAMAAAIAMAESGGNANASNVNSNGSVDRGLWQINSSNGSGSSFDVMTNARAAVQMSNNGTTWRPWCTAYSDGACGTKGGTYLGPNAPYQQFLQSNVPPDCSAPLNGTGAAANGQQDAHQAELTGASDICNSVLGIGFCSVLGGGSDPIGSAIVGVVGTVLNPLISVVAGVLGMTAGGILMLFGLWTMFQQTSVGQGVTKAGVTAGGIALGQPELIAAGTGGIRGAGRQRIATIRGQQTEGRQQRQVQRIGERQIAVSQEQTRGRIAVRQNSPQVQVAAQQAEIAKARLQQEQIRQEHMTTRQQLRNENAKYKNRKPKQ